MQQYALTNVPSKSVCLVDSNVRLPFHWEMLRPHLECPIPQREEANGEVLSGGVIQRLGDETNTFCINPDRGVLPPQGTCRATVAYAPTQVQLLCTQIC